MRRLIVVSNRVNVPSAGAPGSAGGLAMALTAALRKYNGLWFGWSGNATADFSGQLGLRQANGVTTATVDLEDADIRDYYNGFSNRTLWPLFHHRPDLTVFDQGYAEGYFRVNALLARTVRPLIEPGDLVWVHDYHLMPLARELRRLDLRNRIGFFLHVPWPARQLLATLPQAGALVESLFAYDVVGFQTRDWLDAFTDYVVHELGGEAGADGDITCFGRTITARAFPIGIDAEDFIQAAGSATARRFYDQMQRSLDGRLMIVGVDRLDYSKGFEERLGAYQKLLADHAELHRKIFLLQIAPPTREDVAAYQAIRERLDALGGHINGEFADIDWVPFRYVNRGYKRDELAGIYRAGRVALVTPLRDGMNLVAKEYVAAQRPDDPGVLVLSRFAGAASQMGEALLVNPYSGEETATALHQALVMGLAERQRRWESLIDGVRRNDVVAWRDDFVAALGGDAAVARRAELPAQLLSAVMARGAGRRAKGPDERAIALSERPLGELGDAIPLACPPVFRQ